jgi:putative ABC transport system permease protein
MNFFTFTLKNLKRNKNRTFLTILSVVIAITLFTSFLGLNEGYTRSVLKDTENLGVHLLAIPKGCPYEATALIIHGGIIPNYLNENVVKEISNVENVSNYYAMLMGLLPSKELQGATDIIYGVSSGIFQLKKNWGVGKDLFLKEEGVVIGYRKALTYGVKAGDYIRVGNNNNKYKVLYIIPETGTEDDNIIFIPLKLAQKELGVSDEITGVAVSVRDIAKLNATVSEIEKIKDVQVVTMNDVLLTVLGFLNIIRALMFGIVVITIFVSGIQILNSTLLSVLEQIREIGIFKAIGARNSQIAGFIFLQTLIIAVSGCIIAVGASYLIAPIVNWIIKSFILFPPSGSIITFTPIMFLKGMVFAILVALTAGIYPAYKASSLVPAEVIRMEVQI